MWSPKKIKPGVVLLLTSLLLTACSSGNQPTPEPVPAAANAPTQLKHHVDLGHDHIPGAAFPHPPYNSMPPTSGPHTATTAPWRIYSQPVADETLVHNLEHGGIVIGYQCNECAELVKKLTDLVVARKKQGQSMILLAPNPGLNQPIALSAWTVSLELTRLDLPALEAIDAFFTSFYGIDHHLAHKAPAATPPIEGTP